MSKKCIYCKEIKNADAWYTAAYIIGIVLFGVSFVTSGIKMSITLAFLSVIFFVYASIYHVKLNFLRLKKLIVQSKK